MFETGELAQALGVEQPQEAPEAPAVGTQPMGIENRLS
jgi:hypothetical protein